MIFNCGVDWWLHNGTEIDGFNGRGIHVFCVALAQDSWQF